MSDENRVRHSKAENARIVSDDIQKAKLEASNALKQTEQVRQLILQVVDGRPFKLRPSTLLGLNRSAIGHLEKLP
ncbi:hypothetical protein [Roseovarius mucosus]|uniref:hypothetical protein n=1 Tax=Roseovarius mucosus TaxID=215743 RepID=UPI003BABACB6